MDGWMEIIKVKIKGRRKEGQQERDKEAGRKIK